VDVNQSALAARSLPIVEVAQSLSRSNITYPAGQVKDNTFEYVVRVLGAFNKVRRFQPCGGGGGPGASLFHLDPERRP
jgi:multidrug efflux pump subunit AcrB